MSAGREFQVDGAATEKARVASVRVSIATQLNSTRRVRRRSVYSDPPTQLNLTRRPVELSYVAINGPLETSLHRRVRSTRVNPLEVSP